MLLNSTCSDPVAAVAALAEALDLRAPRHFADYLILSHGVIGHYRSRLRDAVRAFTDEHDAFVALGGDRDPVAFAHSAGLDNGARIVARVRFGSPGSFEAGAWMPEFVLSHQNMPTPMPDLRDLLATWACGNPRVLIQVCECLDRCCVAVETAARERRCSA